VQLIDVKVDNGSFSQQLVYLCGLWKVKVAELAIAQQEHYWFRQIRNLQALNRRLALGNVLDTRVNGREDLPCLYMWCRLWPCHRWRVHRLKTQTRWYYRLHTWPSPLCLTGSGS